MQRLALLLSVAAVGVAGWLAWDTCALRREVADLKSEIAEQAALDGRVATLERAAAAKAVEAPRPAEVARPPADGATLGGSGGAPDAGAHSATKANDVIEQLAKRVAALEKSDPSADPLERLQKVTEGLKAKFGPGGAGVPTMKWGATSFYGSVEDAAKDLDLSPGQKSDFDRTIADANRDIDELHTMTQETISNIM